LLSSAQVGRHADWRETYGPSLAIDPRGAVLLDMGGADDGGTAGLGYADLDFGRIAEVRRQLPSLANRREIPN
jgi:predicted amidohydrolase